MFDESNSKRVRISHVPRHREVSASTVFRWAQRRKLPTYRTEAGRTFVDLTDVDRLLGAL